MPNAYAFGYRSTPHVPTGHTFSKLTTARFSARDSASDTVKRVSQQELEKQARRMLADRRSLNLATNFAG